MTRRFAAMLCCAAALGVALTIATPLASHAGEGTPRRSVSAVSITIHQAPASVRRASPARLTAADTTLRYGAPPIEARAAYLIDMSTGKELFAKNADARLAIASTTKITTAVLALRRSRLHDLVKISKKAAAIGESTMALHAGERLTVLQLLYGLMLNSGNDAAIALAEHAAGTERHFVREMNRLAGELHMGNTLYATSHGLDAPHQYSSARDLATIAMYAMQDPTFRKIVASTDYHVRATRHNGEHWLASINRVLYWFPGVDGVKPGNTDAAGWCQVVSAWRNGHHLLAVLLDTPTLVYDIRELLDFGARDFRWVQAPAYWDTPDHALSGGRGAGQWSYFVGAGHYVRGPFKAYFESHGGLNSFGYPRTEEIAEHGATVQYFQGGELMYDTVHHEVRPVSLGASLARRLRCYATAGAPSVVPAFRAFYHRLGEHKVLGAPVSGVEWMAGHRAQYFQYGGIVDVAGMPYLIPIGDERLRVQGWLPITGAADTYPASMAPGVLPALSPPRPPGR